MSSFRIVSIRVLAVSAAVSILALANPARSAAPQLNNVDSSQLDQFFQDFSANSHFAPVTSAASLGRIFGFEIGLVGGISNSPKINSLAQQVDPSASVSMLPNAALMGALTVPLGFTVEATYLPSNTISGVTLNRFGGALKWTFTDDILILPLSLAVRGTYSTTEASYSQTIRNSSTGNQNVNGSIGVSDNVYGLQLLASKDLIFFEPYAGVGMLTASGKANVTAAGGATIFAPSLTSGQSASASVRTTEFFVGANFKMVLLRLGVEYGRLFDTDRYNAKLSFAF